MIIRTKSWINVKSGDLIFNGTAQPPEYVQSLDIYTRESLQLLLVQRAESIAKHVVSHCSATDTAPPDMAGPASEVTIVGSYAIS
jgi:hypothetical protein